MVTILVIDDSEGDQLYNEIILSDYFGEIEILKAYDGVEALEMLEGQEKEPDLILLDINMPRMNGHEFLQTYSEENQRDTPVIVMLTSSNQEQDKNNAKQYKCVKDYLLKPIGDPSLSALETILKEHMSKA